MDDEGIFQDPDVVDCYRHRPDYPVALLQRLAALAQNRRALLDLGCGPGKIGRPLTTGFERVDAIDPSPAMIDLGRSLPGGRASNLTWIVGPGERARMPHAPYDLVAAGASIHWMDQPRVFSRLARLTPRSTIAIVDGDGAHEPPWQEGWQRFMSHWIPRLTGLSFGARAFEQSMRRFAEHVNVLGEESFDGEPIRQSVTDFILCQHSRKTFARRKLGNQASVFDAELFDLLMPHAEDGYLTYTVRTHLSWGTLQP